MKKFILSCLLLICATAQAAELTVFESELPALRGRAMVETKFFVDTQTKEVFAKINVSDEELVYYPHTCQWGPGYPGGHWGPGPIPGRICRPMPTPVRFTLINETVRIENLILVGDKVTYEGASGDVVCGTMKPSRIFKVPTLYLSGKCELEGMILGRRNNSSVVVKFKTR